MEILTLYLKRKFESIIKLIEAVRMSGTHISLAENALHARIRDKLNAESIKLWQAPFYDEPTQGVSDNEILVSRFEFELIKRLD